MYQPGMAQGVAFLFEIILSAESHGSAAFHFGAAFNAMHSVHHAFRAWHQPRAPPLSNCDPFVDDMDACPPLTWPSPELNSLLHCVTLHLGCSASQTDQLTCVGQTTTFNPRILS
eukprot:GGOE01058674.1.p1 GENE.GGOE01058674.1~~GGOE01058674.1.p1  ORF type:complete len:115 (+),score=3.66 GGOE01058674.1:332-676(+)